MKTDESDKPKPKAQADAWFPGMYVFPSWHKFRGHKVGRSVEKFGGLWDGARIDVTTCYTCDTQWKRVAL